MDARSSLSSFFAVLTTLTTRMADQEKQLRLAAKKGDAASIAHLLQAGTDVNAKDDEHGAHHSRTALMLASRYGHAKIVKLLIDGAADVNMKDNDGNTALSWPSGNGHVDVVRLLLTAGADAKVKDNVGDTPLACARRRNHAEVIALIEGVRQLALSADTAGRAGDGVTSAATDATGPAPSSTPQVRPVVRKGLVANSPFLQRESQGDGGGKQASSSSAAAPATTASAKYGGSSTANTDNKHVVEGADKADFMCKFYYTDRQPPNQPSCPAAGHSSHAWESFIVRQIGTSDMYEHGERCRHCGAVR
jgi:hypothetical protein